MQNSGLDARLLNVDSSGGLTMAIGEFGFIGRSTDGGKSWEQVTVDWGRFNDEDMSLIYMMWLSSLEDVSS